MEPEPDAPDPLDPPDPLDLVAARLLDGSAVDWEALVDSGELAAAEARAARLIEQLRHRHTREPAEPQLAGKIDLLEEIGHGAFGRVWRAVDTDLDREVAIKVLRAGAALTDDGRRRFVSEARALAAIDHPNVVRVYGVEEREGELRMRLEYLRGRTLDRVLAEEGPLAPDETCRVGAQLCAALAALHARGLVHRDLKPQNVMREHGGRIVLLDFGLACREDHGPGVVAGTPAVMAPEQFHGVISPRCDGYALGVLLYWMLAGRPPFQAGSVAAVREDILAGRATPLLDVAPATPRWLVAVVERAMAADPDARFPSIGALERALRDPRSAPLRRATRRLLGAAAMVALLTAAVGLYRWSHRPSAPPRLGLQLIAWRDGVERAMHDDDRVRAGDAVELQLATDDDLYLYVFNEDDQGHLFSLFPLDGGGLNNPVPAAARLPGPLLGNAQTWVIDGHATEERLLVIAARQPVEAAERLLREVSAASADAMTFAALDPSTQSLWRGMGTVRPRPPAAAGEPTTARLADLLARVDADRGPIAVRTFKLSHDPE